MSKLAGLTQIQLDDILMQARSSAEKGELPTYIPPLSNPNRRIDLGIQVRQIDGRVLSVGAENYRFPLMSLIKPFVLLYLLNQSNRDLVLDRIDIRSSEYAFNSIAQLELDRHKPRNPMINSGAITLAALLPGDTAASRCQQLCDWLNRSSGSQLTLDLDMVAAVQSLPNPLNQAITHLLHRSGYVDSIGPALDVYQHTSCISGTLDDLTQLGLLLAQPHSQILPRDRRMVTALMLTCGLYEDSGSYAVKIGLPIKSGVSGCLLAIVPGAGAIATYSPPLDRSGNSVAGLVAIERLTDRLNLSIFD
jgi:glutaminase